MSIKSIIANILPDSEISIPRKTIPNRTDRHKKWHWFRLTSYTWNHLKELEEWCVDAPWRGDFRLVGTRTRCPYEVGIAIEDANDAMLYKLTWEQRDRTDDPDDEDYNGPVLEN